MMLILFLTILGVQKKTAGNRKIVDYDTTDGWKIRFRETQKKVGGRAPDAKTTAMQEKGSAYIFEKALEKNSPLAQLKKHCLMIGE